MAASRSLPPPQTAPVRTGPRQACHRTLGSIRRLVRRRNTEPSYPPRPIGSGVISLLSHKVYGQHEWVNDDGLSPPRRRDIDAESPRIIGRRVELPRRGADQATQVGSDGAPSLL